MDLKPLSISTTVPVLPPSSSPRNFTLRVDGPRTLTFSWTEPLKAYQNGPVIGYHLLCKAFKQIRDHEMYVDSEENEMLSDGDYVIAVTVAEFLPNTTYNCSVSAATTAGSGPITSVAVTTPIDG